MSAAPRSRPSRNTRRGFGPLSLSVLLLTACVDQNPTAPAVGDAPPAATAEGVDVASPVLGNRLAYLWAQTASPPLNTPYAPDKQRNYNGFGLANSVTRTGTGAYRVLLGGMAKGATGKETFIVTAYAQTKLRCYIRDWNDVASDLEVRIRCADFAGALTDSRFSFLMVGENSLPGRLAFAWADQPSTTQYTPDLSFSWNPSGNPITITNLAPGLDWGEYSADLGAPGTTGGKETYLISPYGDANALCRLWAWTPASGIVDVDCFDGAGRMADRFYNILQVEQGRPGMRFGYALADQPMNTAPYSPTPSVSNSTGGAITITRTQKGVYTVDFDGLQKPVATRTEIVQVSPYQSIGACSIPAWPKTPSGNGLRVWVVCRNAAGQVADMSFNVVVLE